MTSKKLTPDEAVDVIVAQVATLTEQCAALTADNARLAGERDVGLAVSRQWQADCQAAQREARDLERIKREWSAACDVISDNGCDCECDCQDLHENDHECDASKNDELCVPCRICDAMKKAGAHG